MPNLWPSVPSGTWSICVGICKKSVAHGVWDKPIFADKIF
jgi:hypothetical protein